MAQVSVIVPTRNSGRTLEACLTSIRSQTHPDVEVIVVDNGSTDGTAEIAQRLADATVAYGPVTWRSPSAQRNLGARMARGTYLLFVDSDMRLSADVVADCLRTIHRTGSYGVVIPEISIGDGFWARCRALERSCYSGSDLAEAARFFPRNTFFAVDGYDEQLTALEDWDLSQRIARGTRMARGTAEIYHDEGRLRLRQAAARKRQYGAAFRRLVRKHGKRALGHANFAARLAPFRNWRRLRGAGVAVPGMLLLRTVELVAAASGALGSDPLRGRRAP